MSRSRKGTRLRPDVVPGVEHADKHEKKRSGYSLRYCTTMLPDESLAEQK
jgi:hypothetical protein